VKGTFFVPDYQRGYRWGEDAIRRLLVLGGEFTDQRVQHCGGTSRAKEAVARRRISFSWLRQLLLRRRSSRICTDWSFCPPPRSPLVGAASRSSRSATISRRCRQDSKIP